MLSQEFNLMYAIPISILVCTGEKQTINGSNSPIICYVGEMFLEHYQMNQYAQKTTDTIKVYIIICLTFDK